MIFMRTIKAVIKQRKNTVELLVIKKKTYRKMKVDYFKRRNFTVNFCTKKNNNKKKIHFVEARCRLRCLKYYNYNYKYLIIYGKFGGCILSFSCIILLCVTLMVFALNICCY